MKAIEEGIMNVSNYIEGELEKCTAFIERTRIDSAWATLSNMMDDLDTRFLSIGAAESNEIVHYTSMSKMVAMLESMQEPDASFRMYSTEHFNDPTEGRVLYDQEKTNELYSTLEEKYDWLGKFPRDSSAQSTAVGAYACCFSSPKDMEDDLLLWRLYGDDGKGCSIKTSTLALVEHVVPVEYIDVENIADIQRKTFNAILHIFDNLDRWIREYRIQTVFRDKLLSRHLQEQTLAFIAFIRFCAKNHYYQDEQEYRYVRIADIDEVRVEKSSGDIRLYVEGPSLQNVLSTGSEITVGPAVDSKMIAARYLNHLLNKAGRKGTTRVKLSRKNYGYS